MTQGVFAENLAEASRSRYLTLLKFALTGALYRTEAYDPNIGTESDLVKVKYDSGSRDEGRDWPKIGMTMAGHRALDNVRYALETVVKGGVRGDFLEAGVWRGGSSIYAKGVLKSLGGEGEKRTVWVCDSFQGLPANSTDLDSPLWHEYKYVAVSAQQVRSNFKAFQLLDDNVKFRKGYFVDSLPKVREEVGSLAVLRADGDMYESTMDILFNLYDKVSLGGFVIIDDFGIDECKKAVQLFRKLHGIHERIYHVSVKLMKVYWVKAKHVVINMDWYQTLRKT